MDQNAAIFCVTAILLSPWMRREAPLVLKMLRNWLHYGWLAFTLALIAIGAVEGLSGQ